MTALPISLPDGYSPVVKEGDAVTVGQVVATRILDGDEIINIPKELSIKRNNVKSVLKKNPGEAVEVGDVLAQKKSLFGTKSITLRSRVEGTVVRYERDSGNLVIRGSVTKSGESILSPIEGKVGMCNNNKIVINTDKNILLGKKAIGEDATGEVFILEVDDIYRLDSRAIGKIVVGQNLTREILLKGIGMGVAGLIGTGILDEDISHIEEKNFKTPIIEVDTEGLNQISSWSGKRIFIDPSAKSIIFLSL